jgi:hypothetical protein
LASATSATIPVVLTADQLDDPLATVLAAVKSFAEFAPKSESSGAARDNAEAVERLANAAHVLVEAQQKMPMS